MPKILQLSLKQEPFEVMVTGEKTDEFRIATPWITSRLYHKDKTPKEYDYILFTNGYGLHRPSFLCEYKGFVEAQNSDKTYSNGLHVNYQNLKHFIIKLGKISYVRNYERK